MEREDKRAVRKSVGRVSRFALFYTLLFTLASVVVMVVVTVKQLIGDTNLSEQEIEAIAMDSMGQYSLAALAVGILFILLMRRGKLFREDLRNPEARPMHWPIFAACVVLLFTSQTIATLCDPVIKGAAALLGYSNYSTTDALNDTPVTLWMILYTSFLGPIIEEVVFRGVVIKGLRPYGKVFAITTSAFLFAIFHGDLNQGIFAFICGLVLGYLAMEYHIGWAMLLHIVNNFVIGDMLTGLTSLLPASAQGIVGTGLIIVVGGLGGGLVLWKNRAAIRSYRQQNIAQPGTVKACWTTPSFLIFIALQLVMMTMAFEPMA